MFWSLSLQRQGGSRVTAACELGSVCKALSDLTLKEILEANCAKVLGVRGAAVSPAVLHPGYQGSLVKNFGLYNT